MKGYLSRLILLVMLYAIIFPCAFIWLRKIDFVTVFKIACGIQDKQFLQMVAENLPEMVEKLPKEPYFVDFLREAPEATGICLQIILFEYT